VSTTTLDHVAIWAVDIEVMRTFCEKYFDARSSPKYVNARKRFTSYHESMVADPEGNRIVIAE
jgi:lactoylglutathione lyase